MRNETVEVELKNVVKNPTGVALLLGNKEKVFVIYVDLLMGEQIYNAFNQVRSVARPLSYQLMHHLCLGFNIELQRIVITRMDKGVFFTRIIFRQSSDNFTKVLELDARPSDAILLAMVNQKTILVAKTLFEELPDANDLIEKLTKQ